MTTRSPRTYFNYSSVSGFGDTSTQPETKPGQKYLIKSRCFTTSSIVMVSMSSCLQESTESVAKNGQKMSSRLGVIQLVVVITRIKTGE